MATKVIAICGAGTGISLAVAEKFGKEGFKVALLARTKSKLDDLAAGLKAKGLEAESFPADLGDPAAVKDVLTEVAGKLGPVTVLLWNLYPPAYAPLLELSLDQINQINNFGVTGLIVAAQTISPGFEGQDSPAILVTNGVLRYLEDSVDEMAIQWGTPGLGIFATAKHKAVRLLKVALKPKGVYVGEVTVNAIVKGTSWDRDGTATLEASAIAEKFWELYTQKDATFTEIPPFP